jgi:hypothetical protein
MRGWPAAVVVLALLVAGCTDGGPATSPPGDSYWFVEVTGEEQEVDGGPGVDCDRGFTYAVNATKRQLLVDPNWHPFDPDLVQSMLAVRVDYLGFCPLAYGLHPNWAVPPLDLGVIGEVHLSIDTETGDLMVHVDNDPAGLVKPGEQLRLSGDGEREGYDTHWQAHGEVLIVNHGAWPRSGLLPVAQGPNW